MRNNRNMARGVCIILAVIIVFIFVLLLVPAEAYEGDPVWTARQEELHRQAEEMRAAGISEEKVAPLSAEWWEEKETLDIVARVVQGEAGACPWMHQLAVAAVVVNRIHSPLFPDTAREVVAQPYQYTTLYLYGFDKTSRQCYEAAKKALDGESGVPEDVIWQAEFRQGKEVWWQSDVDTGWWRSTTYFCRGIA